MTEKDKPITPEEAKRILDAEQRRADEAFEQELALLCRKHGYRLSAVPRFTADGRIVADVIKQRVNG